MSALRYRSGARIDELAEGECTMHRARDGLRRWWQLWFRVRTTAGTLEAFVVPMNPGGAYLPQGTGGKTWGLRRSGGGAWQVSPSIDVLKTREIRPGVRATVGSLWHETPQIVGVPDGETWTTNAP